MIRLIRLLEWRRFFKAYRKSGQNLTLFFSPLNVAAFFRVIRVGWTQVELESVVDLNATSGVDRYVFELDDLVFAMTRTHDDIRADLAKRLPDVDQADAGDPPFEAQNLYGVDEFIEFDEGDEGYELR